VFRDLFQRDMLPLTLPSQPFTERASFVYQRRLDCTKPWGRGLSSSGAKSIPRERPSNVPRTCVRSRFLNPIAHCEVRSFDFAAVTITNYT
jgi:hypothetical protein